jgi:hypothetical protein
MKYLVFVLMGFLRTCVMYNIAYNGKNAIHNILSKQPFVINKKTTLSDLLSRVSYGTGNDERFQNETITDTDQLNKIKNNFRLKEILTSLESDEIPIQVKLKILSNNDMLVKPSYCPNLIAGLNCTDF